MHFSMTVLVYNRWLPISSIDISNIVVCQNYWSKAGIKFSLMVLLYNPILGFLVNLKQLGEERSFLTDTSRSLNSGKNKI